MSTYANSRSANLPRSKTARRGSARFGTADQLERTLWRCEREKEGGREGGWVRATARGREIERTRVTADPASPMVVNDRYTKQSADRTHFYTFQSEGQFNCGGRPIRASAIFSASNRPPETVNVCARTAPNDIYIYIDTALNGILNNGGCLNAFATAA